MPHVEPESQRRPVKFAKQMALRGEYVKRQHVDSLQVNFVYSMK